jgi:4-hydroxybenzoate polyprenyltransferase
LVLAALIFSHRMFNLRDAVLAAVALVAFCALSSFAYVLNDISDREADRLNPERRDRPLARRDLTIAQAACFAVALGAIATLWSIALGATSSGLPRSMSLYRSDIHCGPSSTWFLTWSR